MMSQGEPRGQVPRLRASRGTCPLGSCGFFLCQRQNDSQYCDDFFGNYNEIQLELLIISEKTDKIRKRISFSDERRDAVWKKDISV